jgi:hypothetical protein
MGGGCAWLDYDADGWLDLLFIQGSQLGAKESGEHVEVLYRGVPGSTWERVPEWAAPLDRGYGMGVAIADVDNDGFEDVYITNFGPDSFHQNNGDGTFTDRTEVAGLGCPLWGTSAAFGDLDRDGDLDLVVANYVEHDPEIRCVHPGSQRRKYCGPEYYAGQKVILYENREGLGFADVSESSGVARDNTKGLGVVIADLVGDDGWLDVFVANDELPNFLFHNCTSESSGRRSQGKPPLRFKEVGYQLGAAVNAEGVHEANMGIACGDFDRDGRLDLYVTHYFMEHDTLWRNLGPNGFEDVTKSVGLALPTLNRLSWGTNFIDCDNDGWLDLFVTCGHISDLGDGSVPYAMQPQLLQNLGSVRRPPRFRDVTWQAGEYFHERFVGRSSAAGDYNRDGRIDLAVGHHHRPAAILTNTTEGAGRAVGIELLGQKSTRTAIGTRLILRPANATDAAHTVVAEYVGGGSYLAASTAPILIGLGSSTGRFDAELRWPSGAVTRATGLEADGCWLLCESGHALRQWSFAEQESQANGR